MAEGRKKRFGDRWEGRRLRSLPPYNELAPFIMKTKNGSCNKMEDTVEITEAERYIRQKRLNGFPGLGFLHLFIAGYIRVVSQYPGLNRFIAGQRIFARNDIVFIMTIKKNMKTDAPETSIKVSFDPRDTINDVYRKLNEEIGKVRSEGDETNTDDVAATLMKLPRLLLKFCIFILEIMDYFGIVPKSLIQASPFHGSMIITDLGSIGLPAAYHHLYDFGNMPVFVAIGKKRKSVELTPDKGLIERKYIDYKVSSDERICDGFYFSQAIKMFKSIVNRPQLLEYPPDKVIEDVD